MTDIFKDLLSEWMTAEDIEIDKKEIAHGGTCTIRKGKHKQSQVPVIVKVILKQKFNPDDSKRGYTISNLKAEIAILRLLRGTPGIVDFYDVVQTKDSVLLIFEYLEGTTLGKLCTGPMKKEALVATFRQIGRALLHCHQLGIVHRDINPANIMIDGSGEIKLIDFGFAQWLSEGEKVTDFRGTTQYTAPQINEDEVSCDGKPADMWALGVVLYVMATGRMHLPPLGLMKLVWQNKLPLDDLDDDVQDVIRKVVCDDPEKRLTIEQFLSHRLLAEEKKEVVTKTDCQKVSRSDLRVVALTDLNVLSGIPCQDIPAILFGKGSGNEKVVKDARQLYLGLVSQSRLWVQRALTLFGPRTAPDVEE